MKRLGKQVQYYGIDIWITMPYVATDSDGTVCEYQEEPVMTTLGWDNALGHFSEICKVDLAGTNWEKTLARFEV